MGFISEQRQLLMQDLALPAFLISPIFLLPDLSLTYLLVRKYSNSANFSWFNHLPKSAAAYPRRQTLTDLRRAVTFLHYRKQKQFKIPSLSSLIPCRRVLHGCITGSWPSNCCVLFKWLENQCLVIVTKYRVSLAISTGVKQEECFIVLLTRIGV